MSPRRGGGGARKHSQSRGNYNLTCKSSALPNNTTMTKKFQAPSKTYFYSSITPLILESVMLKKLESNDMLRQNLNDTKVIDIQLNRSGTFTFYATDINFFNHLLNDLTKVLAANGQPTATIYVPSQIQ